jgi:YVTN family beta-propeller protein
MFVCYLGFAALGGLTVADAQTYLSPTVVITDGKVLYVAETTANQVCVFDVKSGKPTKAIKLPESPSGLALSPDGTKLYITSASPAGGVFVAETSAKDAAPLLSLGHTPMAPVVSPDGKTLYVANRFNNNVSVVDLATKKETAKIAVLREPNAAAITPDGKFLFVTNHLPAGASDGDYSSAAISIIDTAAKKVTASISLPNGCTGLRGICLSPDAKYAYVTHILARYQLPTTQLERGWMNTNALSVIDVATQKLVNTVLLDDVDLGAANPWAVQCTADGTYICVTTAGTHEVCVIDRAALHDKLTKVAAGEKVSEVSLTADDVPNDLAFLVGMKRRLKLAGNGPRGLAIVGTKAYASEYFTDSIGIVDMNPDVRPKAVSVALGKKEEMTLARKGEMYFNDAGFCFQQWQSCASCHPDIRTDGLNWDLLNDGMGNPKNTKSMLLSHQTPPVMVSGIRGKAEVAVRAGIRHIQFAVRPEEDAVAIDEFLKALKPVPSPYLVGGKLSPAAERGKVVFTKAACATCHGGALYTDLNKYNMGMGKLMDEDMEFDTPTLIESWRTGPYLHDGRATTIKEVLNKHNAEDRHGTTTGLSEEQIKDLAEYVLSL